MHEEKTLRRSPKQARGRQRVDHLLDTAASVFDELGFEAATTNLIARRAGVSIGSLYQFFPNKEALYEALVLRYAEQMRALFSFVPDDSRSLSQQIDAMVDGIAALEQSHSGFKAVFMGSSTATELHLEIVGAVYELLRRHLPDLPEVLCREIAVVGVSIVKGMMPLAGQPDQMPTERVIAAIKRALRAYLRATLVESGHPLLPELA